MTAAERKAVKEQLDAIDERLKSISAMLDLLLRLKGIDPATGAKQAKRRGGKRSGTSAPTGTSAVVDRSGQVIRAIWDLHDCHQRWPTRAEIAKYLELPEAEIATSLRELSNARLFRQRTRQPRRVWMPWGKA